MDRQRTLLLGIILGLLVITISLMTWASWYSSQSTFQAGTENTTLTIPTGEPRLPTPRNEDPSTGSQAARTVTVTVFSDLRCGVCRLSQRELLRALTTLATPVRVVWRDLPANASTEGMFGALAGRCAHVQHKFWDYHDAILASAITQTDVISEAANKAHLNRSNFETCLQDGSHLQRLREDIVLARNFNITETPTFFVGNQKAVSGYVSAITFERLIKAAQR